MAEHRANQSIRHELEMKENWPRSYMFRKKLGRAILENRINKNRKRGRPRRQWEKHIEDVLGMKITEDRRLANNMDEFRTAGRGSTYSSGYTTPKGR